MTAFFLSTQSHTQILVEKEMCRRIHNVTEYGIASTSSILVLEMVTGRAARGPAGPGTGLKIQARGPYGPKRA